jgi:REP-associated tyrosine transposase
MEISLNLSQLWKSGIILQNIVISSPHTLLIKRESMTQSFTQNLQHIIFSTKSRDNWIDPSWEKDLYSYIGGILKRIDCKLLTAGSISDHIHLLTSIDKNLTIPEVVRKIKSSSTNWVKKNIQNRGGFAWQNGYAAFSVSNSNVDKVQNYIMNQRNHHKKINFEEEIKLFLDKHKIPYDKRFLKS